MEMITHNVDAIALEVDFMALFANIAKHALTHA
jgi:hypothetical protein